MRKRHILIFAATIIAGATAKLQAQTTVLTLDECRAMALSDNPRVGLALGKIDQAKAMVKSLKANYFPNFTASATGLYSDADGNMTIDGGNLPVFSTSTGTPMPTGDFAYFPGLDLGYKVGAAFTAGVDLTQPIYQGGKISASVAMARHTLDAARQNRRMVDAQVINDVSVAYANVVKARKTLDIAQAYKTAVLEVKANVEAAISHGLRHKNDLLKVTVRENEADLNILRARNAIRLSKMALCQVVGLDMTTDIDVVDELPQVELPSAIEPASAVDMRPEALMLDAQSRAYESQVKLSRSDMLPKIGLQAGYHYNRGLEVNNKRLLDGGAFSVAVNVTVPLFHFGEHSNRVKADKARHAQSLIERENALQMMELEMRQSFSNLEESAAALEMTTTALAQATENMRVSKVMLDNGMETLSDYLEAQLLWQQAALENVAARCDLFVDYVDYQRASARLID